MDQSIYRFLHGTSREDLTRLYEVPWCALAVTQSLSPLARCLVMSLLYHNVPITPDTLRLWLRPGTEGTLEFSRIERELTSLHILVHPEEAMDAVTLNGLQSTPASGVVLMNATFAASLQGALDGGTEEPWEEETRGLGASLEPPPTLGAIEEYAGSRWRSILHFLLGSGDAAPEPHVTVLLVSTGLILPGVAEQGVVGNVAWGELGRVMSGDAVEPAGQQGGEDTYSTAGAGAGAGAASTPLLAPAKPLTYAQIYKRGKGETHVTHAGYDFLLKDTSVQLWTFMHEYIRTAPSRGLQPTQVLSLLFLLGFTRPGKGYALTSLSPLEVKLMRDFASFGLVFIPPPPLPQTRFYPTSLATLLTQPPEHPQTPGGGEGRRKGEGGGGGGGGGGLGEVGVVQQGGSGGGGGGVHLQAALTKAVGVGEGGPLSLVVETNFRVYAYSSSRLHASLLALFAKVEMVLPNLIVASLTRRSVVYSNTNGISCTRILTFLEAHSDGRGLPENVSQQLLLWEMEKDRVVGRMGVLIGPFQSREQTALVAGCAQSLGALLWDGSGGGGVGGGGGGGGGGFRGAPASSHSLKVCVTQGAIKELRAAVKKLGVRIVKTKGEEEEEGGEEEEEEEVVEVEEGGEEGDGEE